MQNRLRENEVKLPGKRWIEDIGPFAGDEIQLCGFMRGAAWRIGFKKLVKLIPPGIHTENVGRFGLEREAEKPADSGANFEKAAARTNSFQRRQFEVFGSIEVVAAEF